MKPIDVTRVKKTAGGFPVRIYHADDTVIHGAVFRGNVWMLGEWMTDGRMQWASSQLDLVEEPETVEIDVWLNVRENGSSVRWESREQADRNASSDRFACINIKRTVTKGEGLQ